MLKGWDPGWARLAKKRTKLRMSVSDLQVHLNPTTEASEVEYITIPQSYVHEVVYGPHQGCADNQPGNLQISR